MARRAAGDGRRRGRWLSSGDPGDPGNPDDTDARSWDFYTLSFTTPIEYRRISQAEFVASNEGLVARRAHVSPQIPSRLVEIVEARVAPEPAAGASALAAVLALLALRRR